jgi:TRAP-type C4-dicarboxylate transport system permease large subunit
MSTAMLVLCAVFIVGAVLRFPVSLLMFACGLAYLIAAGQDVGLIVDQTLNSMFGLYVLLAVPMFILAGNIMNAATISERIWAAADAVAGRFRGGLGHVTVLMNVIVSSMSGSAVSDAAGAGMVAIRMMRTVGKYPAGFAVALTAAASCLGPIIPPSIPMVIYALISGASVGALFLAGIVPGLLMAASLMALIAIIARRRNLPMGSRIAFREIPKVMGKAAIPLTLPVVLLGGIWGGIFTPTESAAVAALWALLIGVAIYRNLGLKALYAVFALSHMELSPLGFLLLVNVIFLVLGTVLDGAVMLLVFIPVLLPTAKALGIDLVHFGVVAILNFMIAMISPPYGLILFVLSALTGTPMREINREIWQFCVPLTLVLFLLILVPDLTLWLPRLFGYVR